MNARIVDRGRGPEIEGTRITVYDIVDYWRKGWEYDQIAGLFRLPSDDVQEALRYIERHREEVMTEYEKILARHREYVYPAEVQEKLRRSHERFQARVAGLSFPQSDEATHAGSHGRS